MDRSDTLFVGWGDTHGVTAYRSILPAKTMNAECVVFGMAGEPRYRTGTNMKHRIIVLQHGWEHWQLRVMRRMMKTGAKVLLNVDDWIPSVAKMGPNHGLSRHFQEEDRVEEWKRMVREADGVIASTPWLVEKLETLNTNVQLARNGLDLDRYDRFKADERPSGALRVLGWAGGTGHEGAFKSIVPALAEAMEKRPQLKLHVVGDNIGRFMPPHLADRVIHRPWSEHLFYPRHLAEFDLNLAPAMDNDFYRAKSQLRLYEACAMGTPTIGSKLYSEINEAQCGMVAHTGADWAQYIDALFCNHTLLSIYRSRAAAYAQSIRIEKRIDEWTTAIESLTSS